MSQKFSCLSELGGTTNFNTVPFWPFLVCIFNGLADFHKFDIFSRFFQDNLAKIVTANFRNMEKMRLN